MTIKEKQQEEFISYFESYFNEEFNDFTKKRICRLLDEYGDVMFAHSNKKSYEQGYNARAQEEKSNIIIPQVYKRKKRYGNSIGSVSF